MNDIADHSDLSRRTLYHYFNSKEEVSIAAACETLEELLGQIDLVHRAEENGIGRLRLILEIYRRMYDTDPAGFQFIKNFSETLYVLGKNNPFVLQCFELIRRIIEAVSVFITEGIADGSVRAIAEPEKLATTLVSLVHSAIQNAVGDNDVIRLATASSSQEMLEEAFSIFNIYLQPEI